MCNGNSTKLCRRTATKATVTLKVINIFAEFAKIFFCAFVDLCALCIAFVLNLIYLFYQNKFISFLLGHCCDWLL